MLSPAGHEVGAAVGQLLPRTGPSQDFRRLTRGPARPDLPGSRPCRGPRPGGAASPSMARYVSSPAAPHGAAAAPATGSRPPARRARPGRGLRTTAVSVSPSVPRHAADLHDGGDGGHGGRTVRPPGTPVRADFRGSGEARRRRPTASPNAFVQGAPNVRRGDAGGDCLTVAVSLTAGREPARGASRRRIRPFRRSARGASLPPVPPYRRSGGVRGVGGLPSREAASLGCSLPGSTRQLNRTGPDGRRLNRRGVVAVGPPGSTATRYPVAGAIPAESASDQRCSA